MLLNAGQSNIEQLIGGNASGTPLVNIVVGTGTNAPAVTDTTITNPVIKAITSVDYSVPGYISFFTQLTASDPAMTVSEVGLMNSANVLMYRTLVTPVTKAAGGVLTIQYRIKVG